MVYPDLDGKTREDGLALLDEWITSDSLKRHCYSVEAAMRAYAGKLGEDVDAWGLVGLVHDFDYERHPTLDLHPTAGAPVLRERGYPEWLVEAVLSHGEETGVPRDTPLRKTLAAVDELCGFVSAVALVRPSKSVRDVKVSSVKKKLKDRRFAEAVDREQMREAAEHLGVDFDDHIAVVIGALSENAEALGLAGTVSGAPA
jgi:putative nucleotidyltransferase with HDIG domain